MLSILFKNISRGISFAKSNPQILYTLMLMIGIAGAFLWTAFLFAETAEKNQERLELEKIGGIQDVFASFSVPFFNDPEFLQERIEEFRALNESVREFLITEKIGKDQVIIAALNQDRLGEIDEENEKFYQDLEGLSKGGSVVVPFIINGERHLRGYRALTDENNNLLGFLMLDISMRSIDALTKRGLTYAYMWLIIIVIAILFLLLRQARTIDYTTLYRRLKEVDQMKDDFISMAAHELRTPLTVIRGYADLLMDAKGLSEKSIEQLHRIDASAKQLNVLIGDILDVSRLTQGRMKFTFSDIHVSSVLTPFVETFRPIAEKKNLKMLVEIPEKISPFSADVDRLNQVLTNLVGNAVKYTLEGEVRVKAYEENEKIFIRISDTGIGISAEDQQKLFGKFVRIKSDETRDIQGTGLGLWITKEMVRQMNGDITVESIRGKGSDFIISFPSLKQ